MDAWLLPVAGAAGSLAVLWLILVAALWFGRPGEATARELLRVLPDLVRLLHKLARDPELPRGVQLRLWLAVGYLAMPIDLVPDFLPVVGWADDVVVVALVLRAAVRRAGPQTLQRHWPGTPDGLLAVRRLAGVTDEPTPEPTPRCVLPPGVRD